MAKLQIQPLFKTYLFITILKKKPKSCFLKLGIYYHFQILHSNDYILLTTGKTGV